jgi:hypothetical protein
MSDKKENFEDIMDEIRCSTFHHSDETAKPIIDDYIDQYPILLEKHSREWYYKNC